MLFSPDLMPTDGMYIFKNKCPLLGNYFIHVFDLQECSGAATQFTCSLTLTLTLN